MRSFRTFDGLISQTGQFISSNGGIFCEILLEPFDFRFHYGSQGPNVKGRHDYYHDAKLARLWRWRGFGFAYSSDDVDLNNQDGTKSTVTVVRCIVPYWSVVLPLALVSAWLMLSTPRVLKPESNSETNG